MLACYRIVSNIENNDAIQHFKKKLRPLRESIFITHFKMCEVITVHVIAWHFSLKQHYKAAIGLHLNVSASQMSKKSPKTLATAIRG